METQLSWAKKDCQAAFDHADKLVAIPFRADVFIQ